MEGIRTRNLAFVVMLGAGFAATQADLLAVGGAIRSFCDAWEDHGSYDCTDCNTDQSFPPGWDASGSCDFSGIVDEEEMLLTAAAYVQSAGSACDETCGGEYADYIADWYEDFGNPFDPCYQAQKDPQCWVTWSQAGGDAGPQSSWNCSCQYFFYCEC